MSRWEAATEPRTRASHRWSSAGESVVDRVDRLRHALAVGASLTATTSLSDKALQAQRWGIAPPEGQGITVELTPEEYHAKQTKAPIFIQTTSSPRIRRASQSAFGRTSVDLSLCVKAMQEQPNTQPELHQASSDYPSPECSPTRGSNTTHHTNLTSLLANSAPLPVLKASHGLRPQASTASSGHLAASLSNESTAPATTAFFDDLHTTQIRPHPIPECVVCGGEGDSEEEFEAQEVLPSVLQMHRSQLRVDQLLAPTTSQPSSPKHAASQPASYAPSNHGQQRPMSSRPSSPAVCSPLPPSTPRPPQTAQHPTRTGTGRASVRALPSRSSPAALSIISPNPALAAEQSARSSQQAASPFLKAAQTAWPATEGSSSPAQHPALVVRHLRSSSCAGQSGILSGISSPRAGEVPEGAELDGEVEPTRALPSQAQESPRTSGPPVVMPATLRELQLLQSCRSSHSVKSVGRSVRSSWSGSLGTQPVSNCRAVSLQRQGSKQLPKSEQQSMLTAANLQDEAWLQRMGGSSVELPHHCFLPPGELPKAGAPSRTGGSVSRYKLEFHDNMASRGFKSKAFGAP